MKEGKYLVEKWEGGATYSSEPLDVDYAAKVQEILPDVVFVKTDRKVTAENEGELREAIILDNDTPKLNGKKIFPLCVKDYPRTLSFMTASRAGYWALCKCKSQNWPVNMVYSCLSNLEMDL